MRTSTAIVMGIALLAAEATGVSAQSTQALVYGVLVAAGRVDAGA